MKKIALAVALATLSATSMADVILYGQIKGGVEVSKIKGTAGTVTQIVDYGSRIGFKGHEHLTDNLKAIWQLEQSVNIGGGAASKNVIGEDGNVTTVTQSKGFGTRNSFVGLEGAFGRVTVGYQHNIVGDANGDLDIWEYGNDVAGLATFTRATAIAQRTTSVRYQSPEFSGFSFDASISPSDNNNKADASDDDTYSNPDRAVYALGLRYKQAGFFADVMGGYAHGSASSGTKNGYQIVAQAGYDAQPWFAGVAYQRSQNVEKSGPDSVFAGAKVVNEVAGTVAYNVTEPLRLKASVAYGFGIETETGAKLYNNGKYWQGIVGADYALSKRTTANAQLGYLQLGNGAAKERVGVLSVGMKHVF